MESKKKIVLKTHWTRVFEVHEDLLRSKGYTEKMLDSREPEGKFMERLKESIEQAVKNTVWVYRLEQFQIEITGQFNNKRDRVHFQFNYTMDPAGRHLLLSTMKATLDEMVMEYPIHTERDLLPAPVVHQQLSRLNNNLLLHRLKETTGQKNTPRNRRKGT